MFSILSETTLDTKIMWNKVCVSWLKMVWPRCSVVRTLHIRAAPDDSRVICFSLDNGFLDYGLFILNLLTNAT